MDRPPDGVPDTGDERATRRLFVALVPPPAAAERVAAGVRAAFAGAERRLGWRLAPAARLHVTLAFLGDFPDARRADLERQLRGELGGLAAPELEVLGGGAFPSLERPRVLWVGVDEDVPGRVAALARRARQAALGSGWRAPRGERDEPFRPHMTVARPGHGAGLRGPQAPADFARLPRLGGWLADEVELVESWPGGAPPGYRTLLRVPLAVHPG